MKLPKSPPWLIELFDGLLARTIGERRLMFGYPAGFVNGNMFAGLFGESMLVRLDEADRAALLAREGAATFDPMGGRPMREYIVVPHAMLEDEAELARWFGKALAFVEAKPPKAAKKAPAKKAPAKKAAAKRAPARKPASKARRA